MYFKTTLKHVLYYHVLYYWLHYKNKSNCFELNAYTDDMSNDTIYISILLTIGYLRVSYFLFVKENIFPCIWTEIKKFLVNLISS